MATYAGVMHRLDKSIGVLIAALKSMGPAAHENTLTIFLSDNGAERSGGQNGYSWGDPFVSGSYWNYAKVWTHLSNAPYRKYKMHMHQGGIASPMIAHWPARISRRGLGAGRRTRDRHLSDHCSCGGGDDQSVDGCR